MRGGLTLQAVTSRLKFRHLVLLDALGRTHNVHLAAQQMNLTQPAATKILQDVEDLFGFPLFERLPRNMQPTDLGAVIIRYAQETLNAAAKFVEELEHRRKGGYGTLLVGATYGVAPLMAAAIMRIKRRRPLLAIRVLERTSDLLLTALEEKTLDLVIGRFTSEHQHNFFEFRELSATRLCLVVDPKHPLLGEPGLDLARTLDRPWVLAPLTTPIRALFEQSLADQGLHTPVNVVETTSIFQTLQLLQGTDMIAILPESAVGDYIRRGITARLPISFDRELEEYGILTRKGELPSAVAQEFIQIVDDVVRTEQKVLS